MLHVFSYARQVKFWWRQLCFLVGVGNVGTIIGVGVDQFCGWKFVEWVSEVRINWIWIHIVGPDKEGNEEGGRGSSKLMDK